MWLHDMPPVGLCVTVCVFVCVCVCVCSQECVSRLEWSNLKHDLMHRIEEGQVQIDKVWQRCINLACAHKGLRPNLYVLGPPLIDMQCREWLML